MATSKLQEERKTILTWHSIDHITIKSRPTVTFVHCHRSHLKFAGESCYGVIGCFGIAITMIFVTYFGDRGFDDPRKQFLEIEGSIINAINMALQLCFCRFFYHTSS